MMDSVKLLISKIFRAFVEPARIVAQLSYRLMKLRRLIAPEWSKAIDENRRQHLMRAVTKPFDSNAVLVLGVPRSGTTLLASMLAQNENTIVLSEPFLQQLYQGFFRWTDLSGQQRVSIQSVDQFISQCRSDSANVSTVVVKETWRSSSHDVYPNDEFLDSLVNTGVPAIAIVRDPRAVWYSACSRYGAMDHSLPAGPLHIAEWNAFGEWVLSRKIPHIRYEDLVRSPEEWSRFAFQSVGLREGTYLNHVHANAGLGDESALAGGQVHAESIEKFRKLDTAVLEDISVRCRRVASLLGYTGDLID